MIDRELLELAAKAAGIKASVVGSIFWIPEGEEMQRPWSPLTDDGDALRLAVKLSIDVLTPYDDNKSGVFYGTEELWEYASSDPYAATRRAIVRAAAEIGKGMK